MSLWSLLFDCWLAFFCFHTLKCILEGNGSFKFPSQCSALCHFPEFKFYGIIVMMKIIIAHFNSLMSSFLGSACLTNPTTLRETLFHCLLWHRIWPHLMCYILHRWQCRRVFLWAFWDKGLGLISASVWPDPRPCWPSLCESMGLQVHAAVKRYQVIALCWNHIFPLQMRVNCKQIVPPKQKYEQKFTFSLNINLIFFFFLWCLFKEAK